MPIAAVSYSASDLLQGALGAVAIVAVLACVVCYFGTVFWSFGDARRRGRSPWLVAILVAFLAWPLGLVAWLVFRPKAPVGTASVLS